MALGVLLLPSIIIAEPAKGLVDLGTAGLFPEATSMRPLDASVKTEQLRAYHAHLDLIGDAYSHDPEDDDWKPQSIERFVHRTNGQGLTEIVFKVQ